MPEDLQPSSILINARFTFDPLSDPRANVSLVDQDAKEDVIEQGGCYEARNIRTSVWFRTSCEYLLNPMTVSSRARYRPL